MDHHTIILFSETTKAVGEDASYNLAEVDKQFGTKMLTHSIVCWARTLQQKKGKSKSHFLAAPLSLTLLLTLGVWVMVISYWVGPNSASELCWDLMEVTSTPFLTSYSQLRKRCQLQTDICSRIYSWKANGS